MKKSIYAFLCMSFLLTACMQEKPTEQLNILSFNIRLDLASDGANQWANRKDYAIDMIRFYDTDIFGAQEVLLNQLNDMLNNLPEFDYIGVGRDDGQTKGEYIPILYRKDKFELLDGGNFWLAEELNTPGIKGWDAAYVRVTSWGIFKSKQTGDEFFFMNTHLDNEGQIARREGASLLLEQADKLAGGRPIIITGDFNATPDSEPIQVMINTSDPRHMIDSRSVSERRYGPEGSFHNFGRIPIEESELIDYIFIKGDIQVLRHGILSETKGNIYISDHCPVLATIKLGK